MNLAGNKANDEVSFKKRKIFKKDHVRFVCILQLLDKLCGVGMRGRQTRGICRRNMDRAKLLFRKMGATAAAAIFSATLAFSAFPSKPVLAEGLMGAPKALEDKEKAPAKKNEKKPRPYLNWRNPIRGNAWNKSGKPKKRRVSVHKIVKGRQWRKLYLEPVSFKASTVVKSTDKFFKPSEVISKKG